MFSTLRNDLYTITMLDLRFQFVIVVCYRANILNNLDKNAFDQPICEVLLNQKYFNGIGNYLRAEILYR